MCRFLGGSGGGLGKLSVLECDAEENVSELEWKFVALTDACCNDDDEETRDEESMVLLTTLLDVNTVVDCVTVDDVNVCPPSTFSGMLSY